MKKNKSKDKKYIKVLRTFLVILIIIWAYLVFYLSSQNGNESSSLSTKIIEFFIKDQTLVNELVPIVRKLAHFSEYGLGGILFISLFSTYNWSDRRKIITSILLGVWYAITDEFHQTLIPQRHGGIEDVWIDSLGIMTGVVGMLIIIKIILIIKDKKIGDD